MSNQRFPAGFLNCHARGLHSVVLDKYPSGRPRFRLFLTGVDHTLWRNFEDVDETLSVAVHAHRATLTLHPVYGEAFNLPAHIGGDGTLMHSWHHRSHILTGSGGFSPVAPVSIVFDRPQLLAPGRPPIKMASHELHTVGVEEGQIAAWLVEEHELGEAFEELLHTDDDLNRFSFDGMYEPLSHREAAILVQPFMAIIERIMAGVVGQPAGGGQ